ncbi:unnamed protein product [Chrysoparadoxa australica]
MRVAAGMLALVVARTEAWVALRPSAVRLGVRSRLPTLNMSVTSQATPPVEADQGPKALIVGAVKDSLVQAFGQDFADANPLVSSATKEEFGDYQCNAAMALARSLKSKPRDVAERLLEEGGLRARVEGICSPPEIAGPGFINLNLSEDYVATKLKDIYLDQERLSIPKKQGKDALRVVVDFSSPNIAKEMHVGHLRSTIIGDTLCRVLEFLGHDVVRLNHVGDWGTQFGMLITYIKEEGIDVGQDATGDAAGDENVGIGDLVEFYKKAKARFDVDEEFKANSRSEVVRLQAGEEESLKAWGTLCALSRKEFQVIYDMLGVELTERGESFYNPMLSSVIDDLEEQKILEESDGAKVVYLDSKETNRDGSKKALIVRKSDGGFIYSTTDLAAIKHRVSTEKAQRVLYVTDSGQATHFQQVFEVAKRAGLVGEDTSLEHVPFGLVQGEDGKKFKTRSGDTVKLKDLLDEAIQRTEKDMKRRFEEEGKSMTEESAQQVARAVGLGAVKYADLSMNRESNYRFSYDKMLSLQGNTAPYMLYAYVRIQGIKRKASKGLGELDSVQLSLATPEELSLGRALLRLPDILENLEASLYPNGLCEYLYNLSSHFNRFYESCPVNSAETEELKRSRVMLCAVTAQSLKLGLELLGINTVERL